MDFFECKKTTLGYFSNNARVFLNTPKVFLNKAGLLFNKAGLLQNKAGLLQNKAGLLSIFCCFSPKIGICCHSAATQKVPKYWHYRRLVAGWQQKLKIKKFIVTSKHITQYIPARLKSSHQLTLYIFADTLFLSLFSLIIQILFLILHAEIKTF